MKKKKRPMPITPDEYKELKRKEKKLRWRTFPLFLFDGVIEVSQMGENKYGLYDFITNDTYTVTDHIESAIRHIRDFQNPMEPDNDKESGLLHLKHAGWRIIVAVFLMTYKPHLDDRIKLDK